MLLKAHLTSHSKMSGTRWMITPWWLSESLRPILYSSSVYSYHLFLISVRSLPFLFFIMSILAWNVPLIPRIFLKRALVFPFLLFSSVSSYFVHLRSPSYLSLLFSGTLHSVGYIFAFLPCFSLLFFPQLFVENSDISPSCISFVLLWVWSLPPVWCYEPLLLNLFVTSI